MILVAAGVFLLYPRSPPVGQCSGCNGPPFTVGNPVGSTCPIGGTFAVSGCDAGDFVYTLTVEGSASTTVGSIRLHIETTLDMIYLATGAAAGFSLANGSGSIVAQYSASGGEMNMSSDWVFAAGTGESTLVTNLDTILVDMGTVDPHGQGYSFVALVTGGGEDLLALP